MPITSLGPEPNPDAAFTPTPGYAGDNAAPGGIVPLNQPVPKSILQTPFEKVPTSASSGKEWGDYFGRKLGLGTREVIEGITSLPTTVADVGTYPGRWLNRQLGVPTTAPSDLVSKTLDLGLPQPKTEEEKRNAEVIRGGAAMLTPMGVGAVAPRLAAATPPMVRPLVATPGPVSLPAAATQVVAGGTGALAGDKLAESEYVPEWLKPTARLAGNIAGAGAVSGVKSAAETLTNAYTGVRSQLAQAFDRLGIRPGTTASISTSPTARAADAGYSRAPFASDILQPGHQQTVDDFGRAVGDTADILAPKTITAKDAGAATQKLLHDWKETTWPAEQKREWGPLNQRMSGAAVDPAPYRAALEYSASPPALATLPENQRAFASAQARKWLDALNADAPPGKMLTWEQAHALKQRIGDAMGTPDIVSSIGNQQLKSIYGGLAESMEQTATQHGQAGLFNKANQTTINGHQFIDGTMSKAVQKNNQGQELIRPDDAAEALLRDNTGLEQLRARVPEAADHLAAFKLRDMAVARPSQAGATGKETSTGTFLTEANKLRQNDPEGAAALFSHPKVASKLGDLTTVAAQLRATEKNLNTSNTAQTALLYSLPAQMWQGYQWGGLPGMLGLPAATMGIPAAAAKWMTSPMALRLAAAQRGTGTPIRPGVTGLLGDASAQPDDQRR